MQIVRLIHNSDKDDPHQADGVLTEEFKEWLEIYKKKSSQERREENDRDEDNNVF